MDTLTELDRVRGAYRASSFDLVGTDRFRHDLAADLLGMLDDLCDAVAAGTVTPYAVGVTVGYVAAGSGGLDPTATGVLVPREPSPSTPVSEIALRAAFAGITPLPGVAATNPAAIDRLRNAEMRHAFAMLDSGRGPSVRSEARLTMLSDVSDGLRAGTVSAYAVGVVVGCYAYATGCNIVDDAGSLMPWRDFPPTPPVAVAVSGIQAAILAVTA